MRKHSEKFHSRREFLAGASRYAALGLIGACGAALLAKRQRLLQKGYCINRGICAVCGILDNCDLPRAIQARQSLTGADNG